MAQSCYIDDDYEHLDTTLEYVPENILMRDDGSLEFQQLQDDYNSQLELSTDCAKTEDCSVQAVCSHAGNYTVASDYDELVLSSQVIEDGRPIRECDHRCGCNEHVCRNRLVQRGPRKYLEIFHSPVYQSNGLRTSRPIPKGGFICEYAGEVVTPSEAKRRTLSNDASEMSNNYVLCLNEQVSEDGSCTTTTFVDPSRCGNIGRYLNHSCEPNCEVHAVRVDCPIPKICIFASRNIEAYEELCFHYGGGSEDKEEGNGTKEKKAAKACLCRSTKCKAYMPNVQF